MIKKMLAGAALAASVVAMGATASPAMAIGNDEGTTTVNGNGATQAYGNTATGGTESPELGLVQGSLNKPCVGLPVKANAGSLIGAIPVTAQDLNVLASPQNEQCAENSTQAKGDEPLSHLLDNIPVLSANGVANH
ncbi:rodlin [Actinacidiphila acididurans]|uniref:RdlA protein n=1 Tax=Actinacidiphila acididurans TaxID=2784346 RepID=A0ABS2TSH5_9ACTN|nr:rodlin [Actinacidiphila acididurans]MBM9505777.1 RdlA protein [Actinacidiphila acididurans]